MLLESFASTAQSAWTLIRQISSRVQ